MNVERAIGKERVTSIHCWLDSTVALCWINGQGEYHQFVANRVRKIQQHHHIVWRHVPTTENQAYIGSRGGHVVDNELWRHGPKWLSNKGNWPQEILPVVTEEVRKEEKSSAHVMVGAEHQEENEFDKLVESYLLCKTLRICAWIRRFINNCRRTRDERETGPIKYHEIENCTLWWIRLEQNWFREQSCYQTLKLESNLQPRSNGILECRGRIKGEYPIFLPTKSTFTRRILEQAHLTTLHGGVLATMAEVRERYWIPKLRRLVKQVRSKCYGCVKFRAQSFQNPPEERLPTTRAQGSTPFQVLGVDFAGPIRYMAKGKMERKA
ncbi:uncharacterized protein LOC124449238 [Xenia sp. Carnegie-2017]|uniref:uncharacterized protein LOC124449238 n=1 Tax=Xenia sp. Carnegie-2017 TaxID=2897299 RepID=UPI001F042C33|nr:uncharacterized protein LOC124449238 [Xenia sp. Carnegie-2017]